MSRTTVETGADMVAVACPFCMTMLEDDVGSTAGDRGVMVRDMAELLRDAVKAKEETT